VRRVPGVLLLLLLPVLSAGHAFLPPPARADEGEVSVRFIRLLAEVPDSERTGPERLHDVKLRLLPGNIVLLRHGGTAAALMPIERTGGSPDSLRYVYYIERPNLFWIIPGARVKGSATVAQNGLVALDEFRLYWRGDHALGWLYFPVSEEERNLKFSVVSGRTVDRADPMGTKYWVELGSPERPGF
jgi:hypothetical protein